MQGTKEGKEKRKTIKETKKITQGTGKGHTQPKHIIALY